MKRGYLRTRHFFLLGVISLLISAIVPVYAIIDIAESRASKPIITIGEEVTVLEGIHAGNIGFIQSIHTFPEGTRYVVGGLPSSYQEDIYWRQQLAPTGLKSHGAVQDFLNLLRSWMGGNQERWTLKG